MNTYEVTTSNYRLEMDYASNFYPSGVSSLHDIANEFHGIVDVTELTFIENPASSKTYNYHLGHRDGRTYDVTIYLSGSSAEIAFQNSPDKWKVSELTVNMALFSKLIDLVFTMGATRVEISWS